MHSYYFYVSDNFLLRQYYKRNKKMYPNIPEKLTNRCILNCDYVSKVRNRHNTQAHVTI